ncbi:MAG: T9SS type A sorting domain-containing protein [Candidatus Sabulitectum sp.]|nr:T9SS type A sorting domain-containing protein [Candidatus Sabulitectum sp.]
MYKLLMFATLFLVISSQTLAESVVIETTFYSEALAQEKSVHVYLPDGYNSCCGKRYPVIYYLHGAGRLLGHDDFLYLVEVLDCMIENGEINPVVVVRPDGFTTPYPVSFYTGSALYGDVEGYIAQDLIQWVDSNFRTLPNRVKRTVMGHSMGGYGAVKFYGEYPDIFQAAAAVCGSGMDLPVMLSINIHGVLGELPGIPYEYNPSAGFANGVLFSMAGAFSPNLTSPPYYVDLPLDRWANYVPEVWALWMNHNLPQFLQNLPAEDGCAPRIYFDAGTLDQFYILPACNAFADSLDAMGIAYEYQVFLGGHFDKLYERFPIAVRFLCKRMHHNNRQCDDYEELSGVAEPLSTIGFHSAVNDRISNETRITFDLHTSGYVSLDIYDGMGRIIETLINSNMDTGLHTASFNGSGLASGVYFYSISSGGDHATGKVLLVR